MNKEKYAEYKQKMQGLESYLDELQEKHQSVLEAINAVKDMTSIEGPRTTLVPLVDGIFIEAQLEHVTFKVNVGEGVLTKKKPDNLVSLLENRLEDVEKQMTTVENQLMSLYEEIQSL